jgi:hypothetical protein
MSRQKVDNGMIIGLTSSKLTGAMPAIDASALTGIGDGVTKSASDPAINTNPSGGLGTMWFNTSSGEMFACTDATTDENVWTNVGAGEGDVVPISFFGGRGIWAGGYDYLNAGGNINTIEYVTIATPGNATDFGDLTAVNGQFGALSNGTRGVFGQTSNSNTIDYITVATTGNAISFGNLTVARGYNTGTVSDGTKGLWGGGIGPLNVIDYVTIATPGNALDFGDLTVSRYAPAGFASDTRGVWAGGHSGGGLDTIDYATIATTSNAISFGNLTQSRASAAGFSNGTRGITAGGNLSSTSYDIIDYVTIATTSNATDFGDLVLAKIFCAGCSDGTTGLVSGGSVDGATNAAARAVNAATIDSITIATTGNATDFGDLHAGREGVASCSGA